MTERTVVADAGEPVMEQLVFPSVLCGLNGTRLSREAARQAAVIGGPRAEVSYLAVAEQAAEVAAVTGVEPIVIDEGREHAPAEIASASGQLHASLLVIGSRLLSGARALGSVSERVAHEARCLVWSCGPRPSQKRDRADHPRGADRALRLPAAGARARPTAGGRDRRR